MKLKRERNKILPFLQRARISTATERVNQARGDALAIFILEKFYYCKAHRSYIKLSLLPAITLKIGSMKN